ncbi:MAG: hypothetical protein KW788_04235 [Candidatus Doudnabacteria bacterium]|nr:hypothetical protein [Candidatus Doudnabacteria bacterium]
MKARLSVVVLALALVGLAANAQAQVGSGGKARGSGGVEVFSSEQQCFPGFNCFTFFFPSGETGHFNFSVDLDGLLPLIDLTANNPVSGDQIRMTDGSAVVNHVNKSLSGAGACEVNGVAGTCQYNASDRGEPGSDDFFTLQYTSPAGTGAFSGRLLSGNIEIQ